MRNVLGILLVLGFILGLMSSYAAHAAHVAGSDSLSLNVRGDTQALVVDLTLSKQSSVPISDPSDAVYLWNENDEGYRYYMLGEGAGGRENLWVGVGHQPDIEGETEGQDYLIIAVRNIQAQFGQFFAQNLINRFVFNSIPNPGVVEDGGMGIFPERTIVNSGVPGVLRIFAESSMYEMGTNSFLLRFFLDNQHFNLKGFSEKAIVVLGDGSLRVKLLRMAR
ncbi:hypothetical protein WDW86_02930 [Bdellovibrionota bacterium FG-2]